MKLRSRILNRPLQVAKRAVAWGQTTNRKWRNRELLKLRPDVDRQLGRLAPAAAKPPMARRALIDGMFDNPGYWYRLNVFRAALGLDRCDEVGLTGPYSADASRKTLNRFGISRVLAFDDLADAAQATRLDAKRLAADIRRPEDVLDLQLPHGLPASILYDAILKRQRSAVVDVADPRLEQDICQCLVAIRSAERAIDRFDPDVVCLSHAINLRYAALAWLSAKAGRNPVVLFGNYGVPRFWRLKEPDDIFDCIDRPKGSDIDALPAGQARRLEEIGREYLKLRFDGKTTDIGGSYAFSRASMGSPSGLLDEIGWTSDKPIVAVYASNWFDFPHASGMREFRDFLDWIEATLQAAANNSSVNWLFKAHPCDKWYGGVTLKHLMPPSLPSHIRMVPERWTGTDAMSVATALVTYHGTAALEYAAVEKPVLLADRGWYDDCDFTLSARSRQEYLGLLASNWFERLDTAACSRRAAIFSGWYFCTPTWQRDGVLPDDSSQDGMYPALLRHINHRHDVVSTEVQTVRSWYEAGQRFYHTFKMRQADEYGLSNIA